MATVRQLLRVAVSAGVRRMHLLGGRTMPAAPTVSYRLNVIHDQPRRPFFAYFRIAFNSVDKDRLAEVGPDRLCAEWLLKNGGTVTFVGRRPVDDYNSLGPTTAVDAQPHIEMVDATDASIMAIGFQHLRGCREVRSIRLRRCKHMENEALSELHLVSESLRELELEDCFNVTDEGLVSLGALTGLKRLNVRGVPYVQDVDKVRTELQALLPECEISISK